MKTSLPSKMKAVYQERQGSDPLIKEVDIPGPGKGEVLVKMRYAPINPSDLSQLRGTLAPKPDYPFIPGIEGSGEVIAAGKGLIPSLRMGKNVACSPKGKGGTWAEYLVTDATKCIPLGKDIDLQSGSMLIVNPMTALAMIDIARKGKYSSLANNAAASSLGIMLASLCRAHNIKLINIVRNSSQLKLLRDMGSEYVLDSSDANFTDEFRSITTRFKTRLYFDAVGGEQSSLLIKESPDGSRIVLYANLSDNNFSSDSREILQHGKIIEGFSLPLWTGSKSLLQLLRHTARVKSFIASGHRAELRGSYRIDDIAKALEEYKSNMTGGKVLLEL